MATTKKTAKSTSKPARPRAAVKKRSNATGLPTRARRVAARRVPWEHLGHPSSGVIVTGGGSGIGEACALHLAEAGRPVAVWDLNAEGAARVADEANKRFRVPTQSMELDVTDSAKLAAAIATAKEAIGPIGGLVHAAGIDGACLITDMTDEAWDRVLDVNLRAGAILTKELTPSLVEAGPGSAIVHISSIEAFFGHDFLPAYSASKAGLLGLVRSSTRVLGQMGIRVNAVCPGAIHTPLLQPLLDLDGVEEGIVTRTPLERLGQPEDIAKVVRFLLSDEARFVTGTHLTVDGGLTAMAGI